MDANDRQQLIDAVKQLMDEHVRLQAGLTQAVKDFTSRLFLALESSLDAMAREGIPGVGKSRRLVHPAGDGLEGFQMFLQDWSIIFMPLLGLARPNVRDEARIAAVQFKEVAGRLAVFLNDNPQGTAIYDFLIFPDGAWFAWGYGWPKQQSDIESTDFEALAMELIHSFVKDIFVTWNRRDDTMLSSALDPKKRCYYFGLPGDE